MGVIYFPKLIVELAFFFRAEPKEASEFLFRCFRNSI